MAVIAHLWAFLKRQAAALPAACYVAANNVSFLYQSVGQTPEICVSDGEFSRAYSALTSCLSVYSIDTAQATAIAAISAPVSYCNSVVSSLGQAALGSNLASASSAASSSSCASYATARITPPSGLICPATSTASLTPTPTPTPTAFQTYSPTPTSPPADASLTTGTIAGIAVGVAIGCLIILALIVFFIWRHRRSRAQQRATANTTDQEHMEKAQLHSDDYKPPTKELEGSNAFPKMRTIGGLHEMEYRDLSKVRSEMSANESAVAELRGATVGSHVTDSSTLVWSSSRGT